MAEKITVPSLGESVTEATVSKWLKSQGDEVTADEPIVELETDKVNVEVPAPTNGTLGSIKVKEGETVNVGSLLGTISDSNNLKKIKFDIKKTNNNKFSTFNNNGDPQKAAMYKFIDASLKQLNRRNKVSRFKGHNQKNKYFSKLQVET